MKCLLALFALLLSSAVLAEPELHCDVEGSDDRFILYPHQQIFRSEDHGIYLLMGGRTLAVVQLHTLRFNRITNLNIQPQPDRLQLFSGQCRQKNSPHSLPSK